MLRTYVKPYPCCRHLHGPIDAVLAIQERDPIDAETIESVTVETFTAAARHDLRRVGDLLDAQMSIPYAVAITLLHGEVGLAQFEAEARRDPRVAALIDRVEVRTADDCVGDYPAMRPARVTIRAAGGAERSLRVDQPLGEPQHQVVGDAAGALDLLDLLPPGPHVGLRPAAEVVQHLQALRLERLAQFAHPLGAAAGLLPQHRALLGCLGQLPAQLFERL
ncbi:MAG: hypothetical protein GEV09_26115, partial [Pseudonocardiaceae bacterium]|nr:hypothetical protein [Pseudonocardiaceae bacterium]